MRMDSQILTKFLTLILVKLCSSATCHFVFPFFLLAGIRMATWGLFLHSVTSALFSLVIEKFISNYGTRLTYLFGMGVFTIMVGIMLSVSHVSTTILLAALTGFASATISTVPYTLLTTYHEKVDVSKTRTEIKIDLNKLFIFLVLAW